VLIGFPLILEATARFHLLGPVLSALILVVLGGSVLGVAAWRRLTVVAWLGTVGVLVTAIGLMVATGRLDAYFERGLAVWDLAAARLVVEEAGGVVRGLGDAPPSQDMVVSAAEPLVGLLADELAALEAAADAAPAPGGTG